MRDSARHLLHTGLTSIQGPLMFLRGVKDAGLYERVEVLGAEGMRRMGRVVSIADRNVVVEVFQGSDGLSLGRTQLRFLSEPVMLDVGPGMLGRVSASPSTADRRRPPVIASGWTATRSTRCAAKCPANSSRPASPPSTP